jgi:hypothetical protein
MMEGMGKLREQGMPPRGFANPATTLGDKITFMPEGCWTWTGRFTISGYGVAWHRGGSWRAHRAVYDWLVGPIPDGMTLDHTCRNKRCVNPTHMDLVPPRENLRRHHEQLAGRHCFTCTCGQEDS